MRHDWPGNVRELKNLVERLTVRHSGEAPIGPGELPQEIRRFVEDSTPSAAPRVNPAETLFHQIVDEQQSFWTVVYTPFMSRDLTRETLRGARGARTAAHVGQLPGPRRALPYDAGGLQALPELPPEAPVPHAVPAVPWRRHASRVGIHHRDPAPASAARCQQPLVDQSAVGGRQSTVAVDSHVAVDVPVARA